MLAQLAGVGIGFPGLIDFANRRVSSTIDKYSDADSLDLLSWWRERTGLEFAIDNDANCYLLGEMMAGAGRDASQDAGRELSATLLMLGTGIGAAAYVDGQIFHGAHGQAGCLGGHVTVNINGRKCVCGNIGCAEAEASTWALPLKFKETPGHGTSSLAALDEISYKDVWTHSREGDAVARELVDHALRTWGATLISHCHSYDPDIVIIGGGIAKEGAPLFDPLQEYIDQHVWTACAPPRIVPATRPDTAALIGAANLLAR